MRTLAAFPLVVLTVISCIAQDIVTIAPDKAKVVFENDKVRVVRLTVGPHETLRPHDRPSRVVIALTANDVRITGPDGKPRMLHVPPGNIGWGGPTHGRSVTTLDTGLDNIIVEIKGATDPAKPVTHPPSTSDSRALVDRYHQWLLENQYVRVYEVRIPPGQTTDFHTHAYDSVFLQLSGGTTEEQVHGKDWGKPKALEASKVSYSTDSSNPRTHRVRNSGKEEYHLVIVQLMQ